MCGTAAAIDQVGRAQIEPELPLELLDRRLVHAAAHGEPADQVDEAPQRRLGRRPAAGDTTAATASASNRSAWTSSSPSRSGDPLELALDDPRHDDAPAVVEQARDDRGAESARSSGDDRGAFHVCCPRATLSSFRDASAGICGRMRGRPGAAGARAVEPDGGGELPGADAWATGPAACRRVVAGHRRRRELCRAGEVVFVTGTAVRRPQLIDPARVREARGATSTRAEDLLDGPARDPDADGGRPARAARHDPEPAPAPAARARCSAEAWRPGYRDAPAAKRYHQAYRHGLLEHSLTVAQAVSAISATFPGIDRDVAVTGALLHDIGKLDAYELDGGAISMSDDGRLHGEIPLGYYRVRRDDRAARRLPARARAGRAAHHPQPPRLARARQPGRAVHARGDARAHDRQPRRAPGQLRPAREGAAGRASSGRPTTRRSAAGAYFAPPADVRARSRLTQPRQRRATDSASKDRK